jgi:hypothetical protein
MVAEQLLSEEKKWEITQESGQLIKPPKTFNKEIGLVDRPLL